MELGTPNRILYKKIHNSYFYVETHDFLFISVMSELLFEGYGIPAVSYGVDSLFSMYKNNIGDTALIINCGYHTIHFIPVIRGQVIFEHARRINLGRYKFTSFIFC